ncbi:zinc-dependent alcohol dehydrogenase family protein [Aspergillus affinis]|uniref:zinc-dependent alcohol dehydrogenase family protein n=1 Tax=Aspergillus affinis TaxID=1070780 RepID=UPI0022FDC9CB|nr:alcohol dehydrogenase [Aspergillus affinis]KAI9042849.1 alcohol dehydrogenase [Aspergillus affinis]
MNTLQMKALVYKGHSKFGVEERPIPLLAAPSDAIVKMRHTTICGTDLHILKGDVPSVKPNRVIGHEGVGTLIGKGSAVTGLHISDTVLISSISACGVCKSCRKGLNAHCVDGGWVLGNKIDGTHAEYVRIPHATTSLYKLPANINPAAAVALSDALPTGMECGAISASVQPGHLVAIVGAGPVGLAALLSAKLYTPAKMVVIDKDETRLEYARRIGVDHAISADTPDLVKKLYEITEGSGFDSVIEAVGIPSTFELCQQLVAPGGTIANVGVHGRKVDLHLDQLWDRNISIKTQLVNSHSIPTLLRLSQAGLITPETIVTHSFPFSDITGAYASFHNAAELGTLKVKIDFEQDDKEKAATMFRRRSSSLHF